MAIDSDPRQWRKIFNSLVRMLGNQQTEVESLLKERKFLGDRFQIQYDRWVYDVRNLEDKVSQMKRDLSQKDLVQAFEVTKSDLLVGLKQREGFLYKMKLEGVKGELMDFKSWFELMTRECSEPKETSLDKSLEIDKRKGAAVHGGPKFLKNAFKEERHSKMLEDELKKLKRAYEELKFTNNSEISALLSERDFVWNQFNKLEGDYASLLKSRHVEATQANEKIEKLLSRMEELQSLNAEKDDTIINLKANINILEADSGKSNREISRLSKELESLRNSRSTLQTPVLNCCSAEPSTCSLRVQNITSYRKRLAVKEELHGAAPSVDPAMNTEKECIQNSKRKAVDAMPSLENRRSSRRKAVDRVPSSENPRSSKRKAVDVVPSLENPRSSRRKAVDLVSSPENQRSSKRKVIDAVPSLGSPKSSQRKAVDLVPSRENQRTSKRKAIDANSTSIASYSNDLSAAAGIALYSNDLSPKSSQRKAVDLVPSLENQKTSKRKAIDANSTSIASYSSDLSAAAGIALYSNDLSAAAGIALYSNDLSAAAEYIADIFVLISLSSFTMPPKNKKARQDPSQDTPKHAKQLNGEMLMLYTYLALCKRELDTSKDAGSGLSKASWAKIREEYNAKFNITREPKYFSNVWFYQKVKYNAWTWLLRRTENGFNVETRTFHLPPEEWDALIKINENVSTFRKDGLLYEDLMETIFANRVATEHV
ncbi:hypothetical protein GIB67_022881 [Kingdonia uniflora]|uniref:Uncharacterized protein n=1 Tax=Kingdonia uniflora TaxID=39325 RepID=A0A7J7MWP2_9MAGN|nr:hypothetical protein GIB67_022881 [Kingdonia uniflora]